MSDSGLLPIRYSVVERAFQLARSGEFDNIREISEVLRREGYFDVDAHLLDYPLLRKQLREEMQRSRGRWTRQLIARPASSES